MTSTGLDPRRLLAIAFATAAFGGVSGVAFAGWLDNAPAIFLAMAEAGISWCF